jgi:hypothetical protein
LVSGVENLMLVRMNKGPAQIPRRNSWVLGLLFIYGTLVAFGVSSSSLSNLSVSPSEKPGLLLNSPQAVRSDEFLRSTPLILADLNGGSGVSALDAQKSTDITVSSESFPSAVLKWSSPRYLLERGVKIALETDQAFAAIWWFPVFILLIFLPLFLRRIGVTPQISIVTTLLVVFSTSGSWWSLWPFAVLAWPIAGAFFAISGLELLTASRNKQAYVFGGISILVSFAFLLLAAFEYAPWSIPVNIFVFALALVHIGQNSTSSARGKAYLVGYVFALVSLLAGKVILSQSAISTALATVYPGARRSLVGGSWLNLFSGDLSWALQKQSPSVSNQSELATSHIELLLVVVSFIPVILIFKKILGRNLTLIWGTVVLLPFFMWTITPWPNAISEFNPLRFIPPDRIVQILGLPSIVLFGIFASFFRNSFIEDKEIEKRLKNSLLALILIPTLLLILDSNKGFAGLFAPEVVPPKFIWGLAIATVIAIYTSLMIRNVWVAYAPLLILSLLNIVWVNPIVVGLGDLQDSSSAKLVSSLNKQGDQLWASDSFWVDALLMSNGAELASGQQGSGPNRDAYMLLDPTSSSINSWNRGASYVSFIWLDAGKTEVSSPSPDQIRIAVNPCAKELSELEIRWIVSSRALDETCVTKRGELKWMGTDFVVYERK